VVDGLSAARTVLAPAEPAVRALIANPPPVRMATVPSDAATMVLRMSVPFATQ
jgi:hypothetical protein